MHVRPGTPTSESVLPMAEDAFRSCSPVELTREVLTSKFHMRLSDAAKFLGISEPRKGHAEPAAMQQTDPWANTQAIRPP